MFHPMLEFRRKGKLENMYNKYERMQYPFTVSMLPYFSYVTVLIVIFIKRLDQSQVLISVSRDSLEIITFKSFYTTEGENYT